MLLLLPAAGAVGVGVVGGGGGAAAAPAAADVAIAHALFLSLSLLLLLFGLLRLGLWFGVLRYWGHHIPRFCDDAKLRRHVQKAGAVSVAKKAGEGTV